MATMLVLCMLLAHSQDEDALVLLILCIPTMVIISMAMWCAIMPSKEEDES